MKHLIKSPSFEVLSISLEAGNLFPEHVSPKNSYLMMLEGEIHFNIDNRTFHLTPQQVFDFPANTKHFVKALTNAKFLIIR
ncbi:MAG: cupin domain-containing protein [Flavobacteriaceae bacterium]